MICKPCAEASADGVQGEQGHEEYGCPALRTGSKSHCDCQHRTGSLEDHINPEAVKQMIEQGLVQPRTQPNPEG